MPDGKGHKDGGDTLLQNKRMPYRHSYLKGTLHVLGHGLIVAIRLHGVTPTTITRSRSDSWAGGDKENAFMDVVKHDSGRGKVTVVAHVQSRLNHGRLGRRTAC